MKLKIKLWRNGNIVCMQILEKELEGYQFKTKSISISQSPDFYPNTLWIRVADKNNDNWIAQYVCSDEQKAQEYLEKAISWFDDEFVGNTEPKEGDIVVSRTTYWDSFAERVFLFYDKQGRSVCVESKDKYNYENGKSYTAVSCIEFKKPIKKSLYNPETEIWEWEG